MEGSSGRAIHSVGGNSGHGNSATGGHGNSATGAHGNSAPQAAAGRVSNPHREVTWHNAITNSGVSASQDAKFPAVGREHRSKDSAAGRHTVGFETPCFSAVRGQRKQYFTIHPEFASESLSVQKLSLMERTKTYPPRRCASAPPPPRTPRNPITWENPDTGTVRRRRGASSASRANSSQSASTNSSQNSVPMDQIGQERKLETKRRVKSQGTFFSATNSPRKQYFTIHPEWASESASQASRSLSQMTYADRYATFPPRRCRSAPPPRTRNPITWEHSDNPDRR